MGTGRKLFSHQVKIRIQTGVCNGILLMYSVTPPFTLET